MFLAQVFHEPAGPEVRLKVVGICNWFRLLVATICLLRHRRHSWVFKTHFLILTDGDTGFDVYPRNGTFWDAVPRKCEAPTRQYIVGTRIELGLDGSKVSTILSDYNVSPDIKFNLLY